MEKIDITRFLKRRKKTKKYQKNYYEAKKSQYIIMKQFFNCDIIKI